MENTKLVSLKNLVQELHDGHEPEMLKKKFASLLKNISVEEITNLEQTLIAEGLSPVDLQKLCDLHVDVFKGSLTRSGAGKREKLDKIPGHPLHSYRAENKEAKARLGQLGKLAKKLESRQLRTEDIIKIEKAVTDLKKIFVHYQRKENQLFPFLEHKKFDGPTKVMWGKHDEIRATIKETEIALKNAEPGNAGSSDARNASAQCKALMLAMRRMIFMEEHILFPRSKSLLDDSEWEKIREGEDSIGFAWISPGTVYKAGISRKARGVTNVVAAGVTVSAPDKAQLLSGTPANPVESAQAPAGKAAPKAATGGTGALIDLHVGKVAAEVLDVALRSLPIEMSIIDANDEVAYYSDHAERIFPRSPGVIGRNVRNCHPPKSLATVEKIIESFRNGDKDEARFWINLGGKMVVIMYKALRGSNGTYLGTLEITQDATLVRSLEGEKRLLDWD